MWIRERVHNNFAPIFYFLRVCGIREGKHLPHMFGTLGVNLSHLSLHPNNPLIAGQGSPIGGGTWGFGLLFGENSLYATTKHYKVFPLLQQIPQATPLFRLQ
jgi:hypothetical protein